MKQYITKHTVANSVRMRRSNFDGAFLILEGQTDKLVFDRVLDAENCRVEIAHGRWNAIGAVEILDADAVLGILAIVDLDFDLILEQECYSPNIIVTDKHDVECMMLASPAFDRLLTEFASEQKLEAFCAQFGPLVSQYIAEKAMPIGCLRLVSMKRNLNIRFEGLAFKNFVNRDSLEVNVAQLIQEALNNSQMHNLNASDLERAVHEEMGENYYCWYISVGKDMLEILSIALRRLLASANANEVAVELLSKCVRLAYDIEFLRETELYRSILQWQIINPVYTVILAA